MAKPNSGNPQKIFSDSEETFPGSRGKGIARALANQDKSNNGNGNNNPLGNRGQDKSDLERTEGTLGDLVGHPKDDSNWELVFSDEFDGNSLDLSKWNTTYYYGARTNSFNNEAQYYQDDAFELKDGILSIVGEKQDVEAFESVDRYLLSEQGKDLSFDYTSGLLSGHDKFAFTNGYMEISAKVPAGQGLWPAFWMLPSSGEWPPEIDIMEILGDETDTAYQTLHYQDPSQDSGRGKEGGYFSGIDFSEGFHTFAAEWNSDSITWYIDDREVFTVENNIPNQPMYLLANLAIGGDWPGLPDAETFERSTFDIDYIRVYQNQEGTLHGGLADDTLSRHNGHLSGEAGNDTLTLSGFGSLFGGEGDDTLSGGEGDNILSGGNGDDVLIGSGGKDILTGGAGADRFVLGSSEEIFYNNPDETFKGITNAIANQANKKGNGKDQLSGVKPGEALVSQEGTELSKNGNSAHGEILELSDYALIKDFNVREDTIELYGSANDYILGSSPDGSNDQAIYFDANSNGVFNHKDNLIALVQSPTELSLSESYFTFV